MESIRYYFSFRSPYSWLSWQRVHAALEPLPHALEYLPVFPPPGRADEIEPGPVKRRYIRDDVERMASAYGLELRWPQPFDTDWIVPHAAFAYAADHAAAQSFGMLVFKRRFSDGKDIADPALLAEVGEIVGLPGAPIADAALKGGYGERVQRAMAGMRRDYVFGVPTLVYKGEVFWGNDRLEWLMRAVHRNLGREVTNLRADPLARAY